MKKQTAVEWLVSKLYDYPWDDISDRRITEALEMEKEQHDNTAEEWWKEGAHYMESGGKCKWESFEQYYNETFKNKEHCSCGQFIADNKTSSATKCICGKEKFEHI